MSIASRRTLLKSGIALAAGCIARPGLAIDIPGSGAMLNLHDRLTSPVRLEAIDQLRIGDAIWMRVRSTDGDTGYCPGNDRLDVTVALAKQLVIPFFLGKDARDIERLVDGVYTEHDRRGSVYKFAGMPFWNVVAHVEVAIFDLRGKLAGRPVCELLGERRREAIDVYISQFGRETTAEQEVENARRDLEQSGARATKLKIGLRMANSPAQTRRDRRIIELARKTLGDHITIYVDANGSYTRDEAVEMGRFLNAHGVRLFEEPLPWQDYRGTRDVTRSLQDLPIQVAGGEQDSSLWQWGEMTEQRIVDIVRTFIGPVPGSIGGFVRSLRVAQMAAAAGMQFTPHSPTVLPRAAAHLHLCAVVPNLGPFQEYRASGEVTAGRVAVPTGEGLGLQVDARQLEQGQAL